MSAGLEFRVTWKRDGLPRRRKIYQTREGADEYAAMLARLDEEPEVGGRIMDDPPPTIVEGPTVEQRTVGGWRGVAADG